MLEELSLSHTSWIVLFFLLLPVEISEDGIKLQAYHNITFPRAVWKFTVTALEYIWNFRLNYWLTVYEKQGAVSSRLLDLGEELSNASESMHRGKRIILGLL